MTDTKKLLALRRQSKRKKPFFTRKDAHKKSRVKLRWRQPQGRHSPVRQRYRGKPSHVSLGYGSPKEIKHLHSSGLQKVVVSHIQQLEALRPEAHGLVISHSLGDKKRLGLLKAALEKKFRLLNFKEPGKILAQLESEFQKRKEAKKKKMTEKEKKELEKKKKAEEKEKKEKEEKEVPEKKEEKTLEELQKEKKEEERKEMEKVLIQKS